MLPARTWFLVAAIIATCYSGLTAATTTFTVGDDMGWAVPMDSSYYQKWTANKIFVVGDTLNFNWNATHNVANVTEADYKACTKVNYVVGYSSPVKIELKMSGAHYYICTVGPHCSLGQKLAITVTTNLISPTAAPSSPSTTNSNSPTAPSNPSAASSMSLNFFSVHVPLVACYGAILFVLFV